MKRLPALVSIAVCAILASIYIYPIFSGLILLPLDLLVSNSGPWHFASTILLKNSYMVDSIIQMFPWRHLTFISLTHGIVPLWNPYQFTGLPFMAGMKPLVFYPANIFYIFGELQAWNILLWLQLFLSLWFTYLFVASLGIESAFALFAGIAFAFNSLMMSVLEFGSEGHVLLWLPILLYLVKRCIDSMKPWLVSCIALAVSFSIFAGQLQYFAYIALVVAGFILYYGILHRKPFKTILFPFIGIALGCFIAGIQLIPGLVMFQNSYRGMFGGYATFATGLLRPYQLLRLLSPDWFGNPVTLDLHGGYIETTGYFGIIPLFFMVYAVIYNRKNPFVRFFSWVAAIAVVFSMEGFAQLLYTLRIPIITSGSGIRMFSMFLFSGAVLSGFGLNTFVRDARDHIRTRALLCFAGIAACFYIGGMVLLHWNISLGVRLSNIKMEIAALAGLAAAGFAYIRYGKKIPFSNILFVAVVLLLTFGDLFRMGYRFLTFSNYKFLYPDLPVITFVRKDVSSSLGRVYGITEPEINTELGIAGIETYNPLFPSRTAKLLDALQNRPAPKIVGNKYELTKNPRMKPVLDFLGVSLIVVPKGVNPAITIWNESAYQKDITKVYEEAEGSDVYRNNTVYPRFGLFYDVRTNVSDSLALQALSLQTVDFRKTVLIREPLTMTLREGTGSARLISADLNRLEFTVNSSGPSIFYLSDSYDDGWHASVNGRVTPIYHANYNFRGVPVPAGNSEIIFWYLPNSVIIGGTVSAVGITGTLGYLGFALFWSKRKPDEVNDRQQ